MFKLADVFTVGIVIACHRPNIINVLLNIMYNIIIYHLPQKINLKEKYAQNHGYPFKVDEKMIIENGIHFQVIKIWLLR